LKVDLKNAFNFVDREASFEHVCEDFCPSISSHIKFCYTEPVLLFVEVSSDENYQGSAGAGEEKYFLEADPLFQLKQERILLHPLGGGGHNGGSVEVEVRDVDAQGCLESKESQSPANHVLY
jgi:hypothetical protein